jgi:hypothetical protein
MRVPHEGSDTGRFTENTEKFPIAYLIGVNAAGNAISI